MSDSKTKQVDIKEIQINSEWFYKISNSNLLRPFLMSLVSDSNHWLFISSNGGLSAGRKNADHALFPYYTDDKITESAEHTGSKSIFRIQNKKGTHLWEPFSIRQERIYQTSRNLYKSIYGNKVLFEEVNHDLAISFEYKWSTSNTYGFVRKAKLVNFSKEKVQVSILDGIQNILPASVPSDLQNQSSNLVDAYRRNELVKGSSMGIFALSAIIVDRAEPSEALKANVVWSQGFDRVKYLLSSLQLSRFRKGLSINEEYDIKAEKGAYFIHSEIIISAKESKEWMIVADVNKSHSAVIKLIDQVNNQKKIKSLVNENVATGTKRLIGLVASSDGLQKTADQFRDSRHFSNTLFNIMRGGVFDDHYHIEKRDFSEYLKKANLKVYQNNQAILNNLPEKFSLLDLPSFFEQKADANFKRLALEYMPLKFSRRHGDPSRPWNKFSINTRNEIDGSKVLDYEGNWRDIFQNWEALALSYPNFLENMVLKFLNASTFEGYNPYRVTKDGFEWETIEADDPWSYIGYWGDHQIIYLLKFLELIDKYNPGKIQTYFNEEVFVYANVPYKIKPYAQILNNPKDTIEFDHELDKSLRNDKERIGADGALMLDENAAIYKVNFIEKILATILSKLSNFIPEGGIWMNTQRPEWNDANNALVGNGVSMVTLCYLRRFLHFFSQMLDSAKIERITISSELVDFYRQVRRVLEDNRKYLDHKIDDKVRKTIMDGLGQAGSDYRHHIYQKGFWGRKRSITVQGLKNFVGLSNQYMEHAIEANKRNDQLFHTYNLMSVTKNGETSISHLSKMLEGQVAVLSSGYLSAGESLAVLNGLKRSDLFRPDHYSFILYPNRALPSFLEKNNIPENAVNNSLLLSQLIEKNNMEIIEQDIHGGYHFNGIFKNASDLQEALNSLDQGEYGLILEKESRKVLQIFEDVFNHKAYTGRSGTFYGYEGLGSIYWHMVSKLLLAVQECCLKAINTGEKENVIGALLEHYYEINEGLGVHKTPSLYGAFPTDPYSHTPSGKGAQQPGMTGQVKEDIICRFGELGVKVEGGKLYFKPDLLRKVEFHTEPSTFNYIDIQGNQKQINLAPGSLCFTYCQVPIIYQIGHEFQLKIKKKDHKYAIKCDHHLDEVSSKKIFNRSGDILEIHLTINKVTLK